MNLPKLARSALEAVEPEAWARDPGAESAVLCWGKAGLRTARVLASLAKGARHRNSGVKIPSLVIAPHAPESARPGADLDADRFRSWRVIHGEHPLPGDGSFAAGHALLEFFDALRRFDVRHLVVYLSGGASSLAWLPFPGVDPQRLRAELERLYSRPWTIARLNSERAKLCQLKGGGSASWLRSLSPRTTVEVRVLSDVLPYGPEVVGSGPFWDGRVPHRVLASNETWVSAIVDRASRLGTEILVERAGLVAPWRQWQGEIQTRITACLRGRGSGLLILGGEPLVDLASARTGKRGKSGKGGRQTHLAAALLRARASEISRGEIEILCLSSDGVDGASGAAGAWLSRAVGARAIRSPRVLERAIGRMDSATVLGDWGGLVPRASTGTNVQDVVLVRICEAYGL